MNKIIISTLLLFSVNTAIADSVIRHKGKMIEEGDHINAVHQVWGEPAYTVRSERSCGRVLNRSRVYCSNTRKVWKRDDMYWLVQYKGNMIIKIDWTTFKSMIWDEI